jgi:hypothetical protein
MSFLPSTQHLFNSQYMFQPQSVTILLTSFKVLNNFNNVNRAPPCDKIKTHKV